MSVNIAVNENGSTLHSINNCLNSTILGYLRKANSCIRSYACRPYHRLNLDSQGREGRTSRPTQGCFQGDHSVHALPISTLMELATSFPLGFCDRQSS